MPAYNDALLGQMPSPLNGKDMLLNFSDVGIVDVYAEPLVAGVDYTIGAFGNETGSDNTMLDPAVLIWDPAGNLIANVQNGSARTPSFEEQRRDPFWLYRGSLPQSVDPLFSFTPTQTGNYFIGVYDQALRGGTYDLAVEQAGPPVFFS